MFGSLNWRKSGRNGTNKKTADAVLNFYIETYKLFVVKKPELAC